MGGSWEVPISWKGRDTQAKSLLLLAAFLKAEARFLVDFWASNCSNLEELHFTIRNCFLSELCKLYWQRNLCRSWGAGSPHTGTKRVVFPWHMHSWEHISTSRVWQPARAGGGAADSTRTGTSHLPLEWLSPSQEGFFVRHQRGLCLLACVVTWRVPSWGKELVPFSLGLPTSSQQQSCHLGRGRYPAILGVSLFLCDSWDLAILYVMINFWRVFCLLWSHLLVNCYFFT